MKSLVAHVLCLQARLVVFSSLMAFTACLCSLSHGDEPTGFRDIRFGDAPMAGMVKKSGPDLIGLSEYTRAGDKLNVGHVNLFQLKYEFRENRLAAVKLVAADKELIKVIDQVYGPLQVVGRRDLETLAGWPRHYRTYSPSEGLDMLYKRGEKTTVAVIRYAVPELGQNLTDVTLMTNEEADQRTATFKQLLQNQAQGAKRDF
jgi:hypothetical protein